MILRDRNSVSVPFRLDPLSKARLDWIKAHSPRIRPSSSMIMRRALSLYLTHFEQAVSDQEQLESELIRLKASASGDSVPWKVQPDFSSHPGKTVGDWSCEIHKQNLERFFNRPTCFEHIATESQLSLYPIQAEFDFDR